MGKSKANIAHIPHVGWFRHALGEEIISFLRQGYFEASEQAFFWLYLRPGDTFIDCGAHIGLYSINANRAADGAARVIAVEPSGPTADLLEINLKQNGVKDVQIIRSAIWKSAGQIQFITEGEGRAAYAHAAFDKEVVGASVPTVTLDQIVSESGSQVIALVKLDIEGAESEALTGGQNVIEKGMLPVLMVEFTEHNLQRRGLTTAHLVNQLEELEYILCEFSPKSLELAPFSSDGPIWYKNLFACRDLKQVNNQLRTASDSNRMIARDILDRAAACSRFKELEELDHYKTLANEADGFRQWAERAEQMLVSARKTAAENQAWAERAEAMLAEKRSYVDKLTQELKPLREFARRLRWLYKFFD